MDSAHSYTIEAEQELRIEVDHSASIDITVSVAREMHASPTHSYQFRTAHPFFASLMTVGRGDR